MRKPHMQKYGAWLQVKFPRSASEQQSDAQIAWASWTQDAETMESMISRTADTNMEGRFLVSIGQDLESILRGNSDTLEIMFRNGLVNN